MAERKGDGFFKGLKRMAKRFGDTTLRKSAPPLTGVSRGVIVSVDVGNQRATADQSFSVTWEEASDCFSSRDSNVLQLCNLGKFDAYSRLAELYEKEILTDLTLLCQGHILKVHRVVLAVESEYFNRLLSDNDENSEDAITVEIQITMLQKCIEFMYTGKTTIVEDGLEELTEAAYKLEMQDLYCLSKSSILNNTVIAADNCLEIWQEALLINDEDLVSKAKTITLSSFSDLGLSRSDRIGELSWDCVLDLLRHENLSVASSEERLTEAMSWVRRDLEERQKFVGILLRSLPLYDIKEWFLDVALKDDAIKDNPEACDVLEKALKKQDYSEQKQVEAEEGKNREGNGFTLISSADDSDNNDDYPFLKLLDKLHTSLVVVGCADASLRCLTEASVAVMVVPLDTSVCPKHITDLPSSVNVFGGPACCAIGLKVIISGLGDDNNEVWSFNFSKFKWTQEGNLINSRLFHSMVTCDCQLFVLGGKKPGSTSDLVTEVEVFDQENSEWKTAGLLRGCSNASATCACVNGSDIIVYGTCDEHKNSLLQVFSPSAGFTTHHVVIPDGYSPVCGVVVVNNHAITASSAATCKVPLQSLYEDLSTDVATISMFKPPNINCAMVLNESKIRLIGGIPRNVLFSKYTYEADSTDIIEDKEGEWIPVKCHWPVSESIMQPGSICVANFDASKAAG